jgi:N-acetylated-alpha-linked acidic dipeptidase
MAVLVLLAQGATQRPGDSEQQSRRLLTVPIPAPPSSIFGFRNFAAQAKLDVSFQSVPDPGLARQHLKVLTAAPHWASSPEDYATALYVAGRFKAAGLQTEIVPYSVLLNEPTSIVIQAFDRNGVKILAGPTREHVDPIPDGAPGADSANVPDRFQDPFQDDPRIAPAFNGSSPAGDVTAEIVYANYGRRADFDRLAQLGVSVKGRIVLVRYGADFRGVKVYLAQQHGAKGVLIYSDPTDNGFRSGDPYPAGPYRPDSAVQRGSVQFLPIYPGDPTTPGIASVPNLSASKRIPVDKLQYNQPGIPVQPLSSADAAPILQALTGAEAPHDWQGGLPFLYHLGGGRSGDGKAGVVTAHIRLEQDIRLRTIWDVIGKIPGTDDASQLVVAGNHRDAWVYGAVDPNSGTAAMLEAVHGFGTLMQQGWKPKRSIYICSWDAEEEGLIGSTEWVEDHATQLQTAVAYFNTDVGVAGPDFEASAVPSLKRFVREVTMEVPSPKGGSVYDAWLKEQSSPVARDRKLRNGRPLTNDAEPGQVHIGDLGSGSDYTPFLQHAGVPSTDIGSGGRYGVYHSVFDNYAWFTKFADPTFVYEQQQARVFGLEILHMANADVLPYDYVAYAKSIAMYLSTAQAKATGANMPIDFTAASQASARLMKAATAVLAQQQTGKATPAFNAALREFENQLLTPAGLPGRPWFKHSIYAPGEYTGYAAVVIPGVNEAIEAQDLARAKAQGTLLAAALNRGASLLEKAAGM